MCVCVFVCMVVELQGISPIVGHVCAYVYVRVGMCVYVCVHDRGV